MPKISFLVPVYNYQDYLANCIESVLAQSDPSWELLLVDDCSSDASAAICQSYAEQDQRIRAILLKENCGQYQIINRYSLESKAEYSCVLDADDSLAPNYVAKMYAFAHKDSRREITMCLHQNMADGKPLGKNNYGPGIPRRGMLGASEWQRAGLFIDLLGLEYFIIDCGTLVKTELRRKIYAQLPRVPMYAATDDIQALFLALHGKGIAVLKKALYYHNQSSLGTWRNKSQEFQLKKVSSALISLEMIYYLADSQLMGQLANQLANQPAKQPAEQTIFIHQLPMAENIRSKILETLEAMSIDERRDFYRKLLAFFDKTDLPFFVGPLTLLDLEARLLQNDAPAFRLQSAEQENAELKTRKTGSSKLPKPLKPLFIRLRQQLRSFKYFLPYGLIRYIQHKRAWCSAMPSATSDSAKCTEPALVAEDFLLWLTGRCPSIAPNISSAAQKQNVVYSPNGKIQAGVRVADYQKLAAAERRTRAKHCFEHCLQNFYERGCTLSPSSLHRLLTPKLLSPKQVLLRALVRPSKWPSYLLPYAWLRDWKRNRARKS